MNTAEFILALFNADPSGEAEVVVAPMLFGLPGDADWVRPEPGMVCNQGDRCTHVSLTIPDGEAIVAGLISLKAERDALAAQLEGKLGIAPDEAVKGLADVVAASAREPHGDVALHSLLVSGGAAAVASLSERDRPTLRDSLPTYEGVIDEAERVDKGLVVGAEPGPEWARSCRSILKACVEALGLEFDDSPSSPLYQTASVAREDEVIGTAVVKVRIPFATLRKLRRIRTRDRATDGVQERLRAAIINALPEGATAVGSIAVRMPAVCEDVAIEFECDNPEENLGRSKTPANVAAFVLKAPALDRLLLVHSRKEGRAWELPGGAVEPPEYPWTAVVREVAEESGAEFLDLAPTTIPLDGCVVFRGTSETEEFTPGGDADEARWVTRTEASLLTLSDLPSARLIREWLGK